MLYVAAAIIRQNNKILICQRASAGTLPLLWEFPGGKLEPGETMEECIRRECREELDIDLSVMGVFAKTRHFKGSKGIEITFFDSKIISGDLRKKVHHDLKWVQPEELDNYRFCPADEEVVRRLRQNCEERG